MSTIRIYVANLGAYNEGRLAGEWINLPMDAADLQNTLERISGECFVQKCLQCGREWTSKEEERSCTCDAPRVLSRYEEGDELAIHGHEAPFRIGEYADFTALNEVAEALEALEKEYDSAVIGVIVETLADYYGQELGEVAEALTERSFTVYTGVESMADVAREMYEETHTTKALEALPSLISGVNMSIYIDWESMGQDLEINGWNFYREARCAVSVD